MCTVLPASSIAAVLSLQAACVGRFVVWRLLGSSSASARARTDSCAGRVTCPHPPPSSRVCSPRWSWSSPLASPRCFGWLLSLVDQSRPASARRRARPRHRHDDTSQATHQAKREAHTSAATHSHRNESNQRASLFCDQDEKRSAVKHIRTRGTSQPRGKSIGRRCEFERKTGFSALLSLSPSLLSYCLSYSYLN